MKTTLLIKSGDGTILLNKNLEAYSAIGGIAIATKALNKWFDGASDSEAFSWTEITFTITRDGG